MTGIWGRGRSSLGVQLSSLRVQHIHMYICAVCPQSFTSYFPTVRKDGQWVAGSFCTWIEGASPFRLFTATPLFRDPLFLQTGLWAP